MAYLEDERQGGIEKSLDAVNRSFYGDTYQPNTEVEKSSARLAGIDQATKRKSLDAVNREFYGSDYQPTTEPEIESAREEDLRRTTFVEEKDMEAEPPVGQEGVWGGIEETGRGLVRTAKVVVPTMIGEAAEYFDPEGGSEAVGEWGKEVQESSEQWLQDNPEYKTSLTARKKKQDDAFSVHGSAGEAMEMLGPSVAPMAGGAAIGGVIGGALGALGGGVGAIPGAVAGAKAGAWIGSAASLAAFFGSAAINTEKKVREAQLKLGKTEEEANDIARVAGWKSGAIEAGGELVSKIPVFQVLRLLPQSAKKNAVLAATKTMKSPTAAVTDLLKVVGTEVATELAQGAGQQYVESEAGAGEMPTWDSTKGVIMPTILMSALTYGIAEPVGMAQRNQLTKTLSDKDAPVQERVGAVNAVANTINDPELKALWLDHSLRQVQANAPVVLADDVYYSDQEAMRVAEGRPEESIIPTAGAREDEAGQQRVPEQAATETGGISQGEAAQPESGAAEAGAGQGATDQGGAQLLDAQGQPPAAPVEDDGVNDAEREASNDVPPPPRKPGEPHRMMGVDSVVEESAEGADGVNYELYRPVNATPETGAIVRTVDRETGEVISLISYPNPDRARAAFAESTKVAGGKSASQDGETTPVHGDVRQPEGAQEGAGQVSAAEGGQGVRQEEVPGLSRRPISVTADQANELLGTTGGQMVDAGQGGRGRDYQTAVLPPEQLAEIDANAKELGWEKRDSGVEGAARYRVANPQDRRTEAASKLRAEWDSLTPDQQFERATKAHTEARTSPVSGGLPNKLAYSESEKKPVQVFIDVDSLKYINDEVSHPAGDELLRTVGTVLAELTGNAYHISGDEFVIQADTEVEATEIMAKAQEALENTVLVGTKGDKTFTYNPGVSYGVGQTYEAAEKKLQPDKDRRELEGKRAGRGQQPPSMVERPAKGDGDKRGAQGRSEEEVAKEEAAFFDEFDPETIADHPALKNPDTIKALRQLADGAGWTEQGGGRIKSTRTGSGSKSMPWIPLQEWFGRKPSGVTEKHITTAVDRLEAGTKLTKPQRAAVAFMMGELNDAKVSDLTESTPQEIDSSADITKAAADLDAIDEGKGEEILERGAIQGLSNQEILDQLQGAQFDLAPQSEEDIKAIERTLEAQRKEKEEADKKYRADLERDGFLLSGSDREVNEREARGRGSLLSYAGPKAKTADKGALAKAVEMEQAGASSEDIRKETGWFLGMDDKWRFEISDKDMKLKENPVATPGAPGVPPHWKLDALVDHPKLFDAYPELRSVRVETMAGSGRQGSYSSQDNVIQVTKAGRREVLAHEIQHVIQNIERFARGGSAARGQIAPEMWKTAVREMEQKYGDLPSMEKPMLDFLGGKITQDQWENKLVGISQTTHPGGTAGYMFELYQRLAGEIEARDTESRIDLDDTARKEKEPYVGEGIAKEDAIIRFGAAKEGSEQLPNRNVDDVRSQLEDHFGKARINRMEAAGKLHIVETSADLPIPGAPSVVQGMKMPDNGVWINAQATTDSTGSLAAAVLAHEGTHSTEVGEGAMRRVLGVKFDNLHGRLEKLRDQGDEAAVSAWNRIPEGTKEEDIQSELIAYFVEEAYGRIAAGQGNTLSARAMALYKRIVAQVKAWYLRSPVGRDLDFKPTDELMVALVRASLGRGTPVHRGTVLQSKRKRGSTRLNRGVDRLVADAQTMESWKDWYKTYQAKLEELFGEDADLFRKLLSATSQNMSVAGNVTLGLKAYNQLKTGAQFTGYLLPVIGNLDKIRAAVETSGPKINAFERANLGDENAVVIDLHMTELFFNKKTPSKGQHKKAVETVNKVADKLGWTPRQTQAALWAVNHVRRGTAPENVPSYEKILTQRADEIAQLREAFEFTGEGEGVSGRGGADARGAQLSVAGGTAPFGKSQYDNVERRLDAARKRSSLQESLKDKAKGVTKEAWHQFTRAFPLLDKTKFAETLDVLRVWKGIPEFSHKEAYDKIWSYVGKMDETERQVYTMNLVLPDMVQDIEKGVLEDGPTLPFGYPSREAVERDLRNFKEQAKTRPAIGKALKARNAYMTETKKKLVEAKLLSEKVLDNDAYYHHQVLDYMALGDKFQPGTSSGDVRIHKMGWSRARMGSTKDYNLEYLEAEFEVISQQISQLEAKKNLDRIGKIENIKPQLQAQASDKNLKAYLDRHPWANPSQVTAKEMKEDLGDTYRTWRDEMNKKTHTTWKPAPGTVWYHVNTVNDKILEQANKEEWAAVHRDEIGSAMVKGRDVEWVVPPELAETLDDPGQFPNEDTLIGKASAESLRRWKAWTLINPFRVFKYNLNNTSGDLDIALAFDWRILKYVKPAMRDLFKQAHKPETMTPELKKEMSEALRLQAIGSGFVVHDVQDFSKVFKEMTNPTPNWAQRYWKGAKGATNFRENVLRLAAFRYFQDRIEDGYTGAGASNAAEVQAIKDPTERAAKLSRELIGDYGNISHGGQYLRRHMIPFWSWSEINLPRYVRLIKNLKHEGEDAKGLAGVAAWKATKLGIKMSAFATMVMLFNATVFPDEEDELTEEQRRQLHLILGRREDGSIRTIRIQGAFSDALSWAGAEDLPSDVTDIMEGKKTPGEYAQETIAATPSKLWQGAKPIEKTIAETVIGRTTYPDIMQPRAIRDRAEHVMRFLSLGMPYRHMTGKPSRGLGEDLKSIFTYSADPGEQAYYETRSQMHDYLKKQGEDRGGMTPSARSNALYNYKQALKYGDFTAAEKYREEYFELGGSYRGMNISIRRANPIAMLPRKHRGKFLKSRTAKEMATYDRARDWYRRTYRTRRRDGQKAN